MTPGKRSTGPSAASLWTRAALLLTVLVTAALVQDRDAAKPLLWKLRRAFPHIRLAWAGGGGGGKFVAWAKTAIRLTLEIVRMPDDLHTFNVLRRRWVAERTLWWITATAGPSATVNDLAARRESCVYWSMIAVMARCVARQQSAAVQECFARLNIGTVIGLVMVMEARTVTRSAPLR